MNDRDDQILDHIGLYQLTLRCILEQQFFDGANCGNVIQRLITDRKIQRRDGLPGRLAYYQLTRAEAKRRSLPESRARALQNQALHTALAVLWFCTVPDTRRHRVEPVELERVFPDGAPAAIHCIERDSNSHRIIRIKVTDPDSEDTSVLRALRKTVFQTAELPGLRPWLQTGRYTFGILTETAARVEGIRRTIQADEQLSESATFLVEQAPGVRTLNQAIHDRQHRRSQQQFEFTSSEAKNARG